MTIKILVVDDDAALRSALADALSLFRGYTVRLARNGREALEAVRRERPSLVLMDEMMPEMNGREAVRRLRADDELAGIPVVALTGVENSRRAREELLAAGFDAMVCKPVDIHPILNAIDALLPDEACAL